MRASHGRPAWARHVAWVCLLAAGAVHCESEKPRHRHSDDGGEGGEGGEGASNAGVGARAGNAGSAGSGAQTSGGTGASGGNATTAGESGAGGEDPGSGATGGSTGGSGGTDSVSPDCGDGTLDSGEECDDGDTQSGDGCSASCRVETECDPAEQACSQACGNGAVEDGEQCDDGSRNDLDGCSRDCTVEDGFTCSGSPSVCSAATCGDGTKDTGEDCDDGNVLSFDGCSTSCHVEPNCDENGCESSCGDGFVVSGEECDDGNADDDDGCSSDCAVEDGFTCNTASCDRIGGTCAMRVRAVFRDFNASTATGGHPDFQPGFNSAGAIQDLVYEQLDAEGKPVLVAANSTAFLHGTDEFAMWFRDTPQMNASIPGEIVLWDDGLGGYVNRWGALGERFQAPRQFTNVVYGGPQGGGCVACELTGAQVCSDPCEAWPGLGDACCMEAALQEFDGNPLFFPIDGAPEALNETRSEGKVPETYGWAGWPGESDVAEALMISTPIQTATAPFPSTTHNFSFTTELKVWFRYAASRQMVLTVNGDDDLWVFVNGHLAVDLGGWHVPLEGSVTLSGGTVTSSAAVDAEMPPSVVTNSRSAAELGLVDGGIYAISVFQAERQREGSSFRFGLRGFDLERSSCARN